MAYQDTLNFLEKTLLLVEMSLVSCKDVNYSSCWMFHVA